LAKPPIIGIVGPTASGKTAAAIRVAEHVGGEILSCDSVAIYCGLDIGAAKPTLEERARVPHHLIDVAPPSERFSAARWADLASEVAEQVAARGHAVIVCGGSGLYLRAFLTGLALTPPPDPVIRKRHRQTPLNELRAALAEVDPESFARTGPTDFVRTSRALEVFEQTGVPLGEHWRRQARPQRRPALVFGLDPPPGELHQRIDARVEAMLAAGLVDEVRALVARYGPDAPALGSVGYAELRAHLGGGPSLLEASRLIKRNTRRLARRQRTWFRSLPGVLWYASAADLPMGKVAEFLEAHGKRDG
jgi:tRNA dimethylallyltransferase